MEQRISIFVGLKGKNLVEVVGALVSGFRNLEILKAHNAVDTLEAICKSVSCPYLVDVTAKTGVGISNVSCDDRAVRMERCSLVECAMPVFVLARQQVSSFAINHSLGYNEDPFQEIFGFRIT